MNAPQILFYGDDFTGATDALATGARAGLRSLLLLAPPDADRLRTLPPLDCLGIAGAARSMAPDAMRAALAPIAALARQLSPRVLHYKTCSTFDSAPEVGSIGEAARQLLPATGSRHIAIVGGQPGLGRYCLFGNLFAAAGSRGEVFRLDRHPTMSQHPVTPMDESDLRLHLARQGMPDIGLVPWTALAQGTEAAAARLAAEHAQGRHAVLWDAAQADHLRVIGQVAHRSEGTLLSIGPSSVIEAFAATLPAQHRPAPASGTAPAAIGPATGPVLVLAGSLSPVTAQQVAAAHSFHRLHLDAARLASQDSAYMHAMAGDIVRHLQSGRHVLACTVQAHGQRQALPGARLAAACGTLLQATLSAHPVRRAGIAGGDTSSLATQALDAWGLSYLGQVGPGAPLCRVHSAHAGLDGLELMLKGGQMGGEDVFERLVHGTA